MGGGNAQKSATARARNEKLAKQAGKGSQLKQNEAARSIQCQICRQTFLCTATLQKLKEHHESKHSKVAIEQCFPEAKTMTA
ncbi:hypothetical protein WJX84_007605 [Apatococcus fuscideae]|uniref:At2g23090-like zinc-binding domain-containing protein n=1 Tax=Apatococcus fuscideae TaxID=2026836 RepID=A0AAW1TH34_9CHLO